MSMEHSNIASISQTRCMSCGACKNICPRCAISMEASSVGFLFPKINFDLCVNCGKCIDVCPAADDIVKNETPKIYSLTMPENIAKVSSSGGMFTLLADYVLDKNGIVFGVAFDDDYLGAHHIGIERKEDLYKLRGSKYVQSVLGDTYCRIKEELKKGRWVLFSGCGCQAHGLKCFLGKEYEKLIVVDLLCHGAPSPLAYKSYVTELAGGKEIQSVNFREKAYFGWGSSLSVFYTDGSVTREDCRKSKFYRGFLSGLLQKDACSSCQYASPYTHQSEITIGDFWGIRKIAPESHDDNGVNMIIVNNNKGLRIFNECIAKSNAKYCEQDLKKTYELCKSENGQFIAPLHAHWAKRHFFDALPYKGYTRAFNEAVQSDYDVGIIGWWLNANYGGVMTYYALNRVINDMGLSVLMIRHIRWPSEENPDRSSVVYRFADKHYNISQNYHKDKLYCLNDRVKTFVSGSDQMFNPWLWTWSGKEYFFSFAEINHNIVSYASSFGNSYDVNNQHHIEISYLLHRFSSVSVREDYGVDICRDAFGIEAQHVVDPVFLCNPKYYDELAQESQMTKEGSYVLNFILDPDEDKRRILPQIAEQVGMNFKSVVNLDKHEENAEKLGLPNTLHGISVEDWLRCYKDADYVITDSFHGTCFSILFRKKFITIANHSRGAKRMEVLLNMAGLSDRMVNDVNDISSDLLMQSIDYDAVFARIAPIVEESRKWLYEAITAPRSAILGESARMDYRIGKLENSVAQLSGVEQMIGSLGESARMDYRIGKLENSVVQLSGVEQMIGSIQNTKNQFESGKNALKKEIEELRATNEKLNTRVQQLEALVTSESVMDVALRKYRQMKNGKKDRK